MEIGGDVAAKNATPKVFSPDKMEKVREKRQMSRRTLSIAVNVTEGTLYNWAIGRYTPDVNQASVLAAALGVNLDDLFE